MWDGTFSPFRKEIGSVEYVPLLDMEEADWNILEYEGLRSVAKNRIASMIVEGTLTGFFRVNIMMKAKQKGSYYWPGTADMAKKFQTERSHDFFKYEKDQELDSDRAAQVTLLTGLVASLPPSGNEELIAFMEVRFQDDNDIQRLREKRDELSKSAEHLLTVILLYRHYTFEEMQDLLLEI